MKRRTFLKGLLFGTGVVIGTVTLGKWRPFRTWDELLREEATQEDLWDMLSKIHEKPVPTGMLSSCDPETGDIKLIKTWYSDGSSKKEEN